MRPITIFSESFFDGFTMGGFFRKLPQPGRATRMFEAPAKVAVPESSTIGFAHNPITGFVSVSGSLRDVPEQSLHTMIELLKTEDAERKSFRKIPEGAAHGASR